MNKANYSEIYLFKVTSINYIYKVTVIVIIGKLASLANTTGLSTQGWVPGQQGQAGRESQGARMLLQWLLMGEGFLPNQKKSNSDILITDTNVWPGMGFTVIFFSRNCLFVLSYAVCQISISYQSWNTSTSLCGGGLISPFYKFIFSTNELV